MKWPVRYAEKWLRDPRQWSRSWWRSIDARASRIEVAIAAGVSVIRVIDDGIGMDRGDALRSRAAYSSKIRSGQDLARIQTLGFRGEALPSIASVPAVGPARRAGGTEIRVRGQIESVRASVKHRDANRCGPVYHCPHRKFLRSDNTEEHVQHQLSSRRLDTLKSDSFRSATRPNVFQAPCPRERIQDLRGSGCSSNCWKFSPSRWNLQASLKGGERLTKAEQILCERSSVENITISTDCVRVIAALMRSPGDLFIWKWMKRRGR
jgi:hypothetical protein